MDLSTFSLQKAGPADTQRSFEVRVQIDRVRTNLTGSAFDLAELLLEARENAYHVDWGYSRFGDWIRESKLDMSERTAYYLMAIVTGAKTLGISRDELNKAGISKLKEIFSLDVAEHGDHIKKLVADSSDVTLEDVQNTVSIIKQGVGDDPVLHKTFSFKKSAYEETVKPAIERARREHGDTILNDEVSDITPGRALELICADYLASPSEEFEIPQESVIGY